MEQADSTQAPYLFTVGHSNHRLEEFLGLLKSHGIEVLVDTRSYPYSRYVQHFNREELNAALKTAGVKYLFLGRELGGRPEGDEFYDEEGHVLYDRVAASPHFLEGIVRLEKGIREYRVAIMCSEENPGVCHRHLLVGRVMATRGAKIYHIRGDGSLQADPEPSAPGSGQGLLFEAPGESRWRSLQSVSRKRRPRSSSDSSSETGSSGLSMSD